MKDDYSAILGHEPSEKARQTLDRLEALAQRLHDESPDLTEFEVWQIIDEAAKAVIAKRHKEAATT